MDEREGVVKILATGRAVPFQYDHNRREFQFVTTTLSPDDVPQHGYIHAEDGVTPESVDYWARKNSFLILRNPITTAIGREAIESIWSGVLQRETNEVMADVLAEQLGDIKVSERNRWLELGSFGVEKLASGECSVQTVGTCACMGVDYTVHERWRRVGFSEYTAHNVDRREQRASLLAGLGHLAYVANRYINTPR